MKSSNKISCLIINNKKGIELSINFVVVIILSIIILTLGIYLFTQIKGEIEELYIEVSQEAKDDIFSILDKRQDELIFIPNIIKELNLGEVAHFPIGIRSDTSKCGAVSESQFEITMKPEIVVDENNREVSITNEMKTQIDTWYFKEPLRLKLRNNEKEAVDRPVVAGVGAQQGYTYGFDVKITCDGINPYGEKSHKIFIFVK